MKKLIAFLCLLGSAFATTAVSGSLKDAATNTVSAGSFVRFYLRGCGSNQPRVNGTALIPPRGSQSYYVDLSPDANGAISGTVYSTRDAAGTGNGDITCGTSLTSAFYGVVVYFNGSPGVETPVHAKSGVTLDITQMTPITSNPVTTAPTGDSTYCRIDASNCGFTGNVSTVGKLSQARTGTFTNGQMNQDATFLLNGLSPLTEYQASVGSVYSTNALIGGLTIPNTSAVQSASGVAAFVNNGAGPSGTVGLATFSQCRDVVNGSRCWGGNLVAIDTAGLTNNVYLNGLEVDVQPQNVTGTYGGTGGIAGIDAFLISSQSGNFGGEAFGAYTAGSGSPKWDTGFASNDAAAVTAFAAGVSASANNSPSQTIAMTMNDSCVTKRTTARQFLANGFVLDSVPTTGGAGWQFQFGSNVVGTINSTGGYQCLEGSASSGIAGSDVLYCDSVSHRFKMNNNNGTPAQVVASGLDINTSDQVVATHLVLPLNGDSTTGGATRLSNNFAILTADFTTANASGFQTITGLSFTLAANTAQNVPFTCELAYSQATNVSDSFGIQSATISPTRIDGFGYMNTSTTVQTFGNLVNLTSTTATAIVTATPTVATVNGVRMTGTIQNPSNASTNVINFAESQSTAADVVVIKAGSWCRLW